MNSYRPLKRSCYICNGARRDCRENTSTGLIHCRHEEASTVPGFKFVGQDSIGFNMWAVDDGHRNQADWEAHRQQRSCERERRQREEAENYSQLLNAEERDRNIRKLHQQLGLTTRHRQNLQERKLTDAQIDAGKFFSIAPWQEVNCINSRLAGVDLWGKKLLISEPGFACPIFNTEGLIIGWQTRFDNTTEGKYRWPTSKTKKRPNGATAHLQNGELPITCCRPVEPYGMGGTRFSSIGLVEGFLKPYITAQKLSQVVIGAAGGNFDSSPKQLKQYLETLSLEQYLETLSLGLSLEHWEAPKVDLYPDAGAIANKTVLESYKRTIQLVQSWGYEVRVVWWGQVDKSHPDIDELDSFDPGFGSDVYLKPEDFFELADKERYHQEVAKAQKKLNTLTYKPDILLHEEYLPANLWSKLPDSGILNLKARKGGGKSTVLRESIKKYKVQGRKVLSITPRIALGREQAFKWDITWIDECGVEGNYSLSSGMLGREEALGLCWDSLWKVTGKNWEGAVLVIDESELGFKHLATSSTCAERRAFIMVGFAQLLGKVLGTGGLVILSDADLTDVSVDYVRAFAPKDTPVFTVVNTHTGTPWDVDLFLGKRGTAEESILDNVAAGLKTAVPTDSQYEAEALERKIIEHYPAAKIIRIDRKTCQEDLGREFVKDPNGSIESLQPDVLIYTPSMGTGVSIDGEYFDAVVGLFFAVIEPTEACQMMARVRDTTIPRSAWCKDANYDSPGCKSPLPDVVKKQLFKFHSTTSSLLGLASALSGSDDDGAALDTLNRLWDKENQEWKSPHIDLYANVKARRNFGLSQFAPQFRQQLIDDGHSVSVTEGDKSAFSEEIADAKKEIKLAEAFAIANSEEINIEIARAILSNPNSKEKDRQKAYRAVLADSLPSVELTPNFVYKAAIADKGRWLARHRLFWMLTNPDKAQILDAKQWRWHLGKLQVFLPDIHTYSLQVKVLRDVGILDLIDPEREFCAKDEEVRSFLGRAMFMRHRLKTAFDLTVTAKTEPVRLLGMLLQRVGLGLKGTKREGKREEQLRYYKIDHTSFADPDRLAVLEALTQKYDTLSDESGSQGSADYTTNEPVVSKNFGSQNIPLDINNRDVLATEIEPLEPASNIEIRQPLATEIELNPSREIVPVSSPHVPVSFGVGLVMPGSIVECLGKQGRWTVKYCTGVAASVFDRYGREEYVSCQHLRLARVPA